MNSFVHRGALLLNHAIAIVLKFIALKFIALKFISIALKFIALGLLLQRNISVLQLAWCLPDCDPGEACDRIQMDQRAAGMRARPERIATV